MALDFDGVISDSALECFWVASGTEADLAAAPDAPAPDALPPGPDALRADPRWQAFMDLMPLGNRAEDFGVALRSIAEGVPVAGPEDYAVFKAACGSDWLDRFHARFYQRRAALAAAHPEVWLGLMQAYPGIPEALSGLAGAFELAIATSKDRASVLALLRSYGLSGRIAEDRVLDKESGPSKAVHLEALSARCGVPFSRICFVDDKLSHLEAVAALGVSCVLAAWGYNGPREQGGARERGFRVCALPDFEDTLRGLGGASAEA